MDRVEGPPPADAVEPAGNKSPREALTASVAQPDASWQQEHLPVASTSTDAFLDVLGGGDAAVEELTVRNYRSMQGLYMNPAPPAAAGRMWQNFARMGRAPVRNESMNRQLDVGFLMPKFAVPMAPAPVPVPVPVPALLQPQLQLIYPVALENLRGAATNGMQTRAVPPSGFPQFASRSNSKGKGVADQPERGHGLPGVVFQNQDRECSSQGLEMGNDAARRSSDVRTVSFQNQDRERSNQSLETGSGASRRSDVRMGSIQSQDREMSSQGLQTGFGAARRSDVRTGSFQIQDRERSSQGLETGSGVARRSDMRTGSIRNQDRESSSQSMEMGYDIAGGSDVRQGSKGTPTGEEDTVLDARRYGIGMREWLGQQNKKINKAERMYIFRQIVELVDFAHSEGMVLKHLRPSYFRILLVNQVKYIGSFYPSCQMRLEDMKNQDASKLKRHSKRKRRLEQYSESHIAPKQQRFAEHGEVGLGHRTVPAQANIERDAVGTGDAGNSRRGKSGYDYRKQPKLHEPYYGNISQSPAVGISGCPLSKSEFENFEDGWYVSPEELEGLYSISSNIYNLGVLLFELFCYFKTWDVYFAAMTDLRHRILPPHFLSESPQEASFCLWLLHPESSSRPKSKDILSCNLICEGRDLPSMDQSLGSIDEKDAESDLLLHFLLISKEQKEKQATKLAADLVFLQKDKKEVEKRHLSKTKVLPSAGISLTNSSDISDSSPYDELPAVEPVHRLPLSNPNKDWLMGNIDQLQKAYFAVRSEIELPEAITAVRSDTEVLKIRDKFSEVQSDADECKESTDPVGYFFEGLCKYALYSRFKLCGRVRNVDTLSSTNVICSMSFDRDEEYFAAAGVSKKIKIFEFNALLNDSVDIHYPLTEMSSKSKLSCVCWNKYIKNYLASADYDGVVQLWDASTGQAFTQYAEHRRRAWSVDFSQADPVKLASGSDDCFVKLWTVNEKKCINTIRSKANVCCVQFSPYSSNLLAFGSADYKIRCYDLRYTRIPWCTLSGHGKAVSFVKFLDFETVVSASTDNTLKLWNLNKSDETGSSMDACTLTFRGHANEKNFVGLSASNGYIACGSETNEVYAYYKTLPMSITSYNFGSIDPITGLETDDDNAQFVSSVCWRGMSNMIVAANSTGTIKLLQLV